MKFIANSGLASLLNYRWKLVGNYSEQIMNTTEIGNIEYAIKFMGKFFKSVGNSNLEIGDYEEIREEDFKKIPNPLGIIGDY